MIFFYDMDEVIIQEDSVDVQKIMDAHVKSYYTAPPLPNLLASSNAWPLGPTPSWKDIVKTIKDQLQHLMRFWSYNPLWDPKDLDVRLLFVQFTREFWLQLGEAQTTNDFEDAIFINLRICDNLKEVMACWSLDHVNKWILSIQFQACSVGLGETNLDTLIYHLSKDTPHSFQIQISPHHNHQNGKHIGQRATLHILIEFVLSYLGIYNVVVSQLDLDMSRGIIVKPVMMGCQEVAPVSSVLHR
jgi:hypothetical protein